MAGIRTIDIVKAFCCTMVLSMIMTGFLCAQTSLTRYTKKLAVQDIEYLREAIKNTHPMPFAYTTEQQFNAMVDKEIYQLKDTVDYYALRNSIRRIVYYVHCVHSNVLSRHISKKEALLLSDRFFPLELRWLGNDFYVLRNYSNDSLIQPGNKVISINGVPMGAIADSIKKYRSGDGPGDDFIRGLLNLPFQFNLLYDLHFPEDSCYQIQYMDSTNKVHSTVVHAIYEPLTKPVKNDTSAYLYIDRSRNIRLKSIGNGIMFLRLDNFDGVQVFNYRKVFQLIASSHCKHLILDLRNNYGGTMDNANNILSYMIDSTASFSLTAPVNTREFEYYNAEGMLQRVAGMLYFMVLDKSTGSIEKGKWKWQTIVEPKKKYNYKGRLYVLINEHTLSAASYLASQLKHRVGALLIGSPSGGGEFGNAGYTYTSVTLPNSKSKIKIPHNWINYDLSHSHHHELYPNEIVQPRIDDLLHQRDIVLQRAIQLMESEMQ